jgi:hypothetical protein
LLVDPDPFPFPGHPAFAIIICVRLLAIKGMLCQQRSATVSEGAHLGKGSFINGLEGRYQEHAHEYEQQQGREFFAWRIHKENG